MPKFTGPTYITSIALASGPLAIVDGVASLDDPTDGDVAGLAANGFTMIDDATPSDIPADQAAVDPQPDAPPTKAKATKPAEDAAPAAADPPASTDAPTA